MRKLVLLSLLCLLALPVLSLANDLAHYSGPTNPGWIAGGAVAANVKAIDTFQGVKAMFNSIEDFGDGDEEGDGSPLAKWLIEHTNNGQQDVIITDSGTCPSAMYAFPNKDPDGSNIENFIEAGNVHINVADWIYYMSYEGGVRSPNNGPDGAANVFDIKGLSFGSRSGNIKPNANGKKYIPSMKAFKSDRPWHTEQFKGSDWDLVLFGEDGDDADPAVAIAKKAGKDGTGMIAAMWQAAKPKWPDKPDIRGIGVAEFMVNWLQVNGTFNVDAKHKMTTTWSRVKSANIN